MWAAPSSPTASSIRVSSAVASTPRGERVAVGPVDATRPEPSRSRARAGGGVEREPLERVVRRADPVEVAPEPARREPRVRRADLLVVARREVRLVRVVVADRRDHADLALAVQLSRARSAAGCQRSRRPRRTACPRSAGARASGGTGSRAGRRPGRASRASRCRRRGRPRRARGRVVRRVGEPVDVERRSAGRAPYTAARAPSRFERKLRRVSPVPGGAGMPGSIAGRPSPGDRVRARRSRRRRSSTAHAVWTSGESAISCRTACSATSGVARLQLSCARRRRDRSAWASSAWATPRAERAVDERRSRCVRRCVTSTRPGRPGHEPAPAEGRRVEPARCRPSRRRSAGRRAAGPAAALRSAQFATCHAAAARAQQPGGVHDRRLDHARPVVERRVQEDRLDDGPHLEPFAVERLQRALCRAVGSVGMK